MRISDWSSDVCSSDLRLACLCLPLGQQVGVLAADDAPVQVHVDVAAAQQNHGRPPLDLALAQQRGDADRRAALDDLALLGVGVADGAGDLRQIGRATSELQSLMRISYAVFCLKKKNTTSKYRKT